MSFKKIAEKSLFFTVLFIGLFLILYPFYPSIKFWFHNIRNVGNKIPYETKLASDDLNSTGDEPFVLINAPIPSDNRLVIPGIEVDTKIVEGSGDWVLSKGTWHRPGTGDPVIGGNFVVTGHRFQYLPPNNTTFYNLDKLKEGDVVIVYWEGVEYDYVIIGESFVVESDQIEIEEDQGYDVLTLYTCTPIWTSEKRLVIRAKPYGVGDILNILE